MTPKEKAKELVFRFGKIDHINDRCLPIKQAKQCAIKCVDEILKSGFGSRKIEYYYAPNSSRVIEPKQYWQQVKEEINQL